MAFAVQDHNSAPSSNIQGTQVALFGGGCFWGLELAFQRVSGVTRTRVGYANGKTQNPTYKDVKTGNTGHVEVVEVKFRTPALLRPSTIWIVH